LLFTLLIAVGLQAMAYTFRANPEEPVSGENCAGVGNLGGWAAARDGIERVGLWIDDSYAIGIPSVGSRRDMGSALSGTTD
jgi:hypothetical protein